jgi:hypothetical protein
MTPEITARSSNDWRWRQFYDGTDWVSLAETIVPIMRRLAASLVSS